MKKLLIAVLFLGVTAAQISATCPYDGEECAATYESGSDYDDGDGDE
jgi:hypothetical protein